MRIVFDDGSSVLAVNADGTGLRTVVDANPGFGFRDGFYAEVSPDGSTIAYTSCQYTSEISEYRKREGVTERDYYHYEIGTVAIDGTQVTRITENENIDHYPTWSPDGKRMVSIRGEDPYEHATKVSQTMLRDGSDKRDVVVNWLTAKGVPDEITYTRIPLFVPRWSPDGRHLAVVVKEVGETSWAAQFAIYTIGVDGSQPRRISETASQPSWSPDGSRIALARVERDEIVLITLASDGSDSTQVTKITKMGKYIEDNASRYDSWIDVLSWSPDGAHIMFGCDVGLCIVNVESGVVSESSVEDVPPNPKYPYYYTGQWAHLEAAWSPDGSRIAVRAPNFPSAEPGGYSVVYTMDPDGTNVEVLVRSGIAKSPQDSILGEYESEMAACSNGNVIPEPESNPGLVADCVTLMLVRNTLAREVPLNWGPDVPIDQWEGITIGGEPPRVIGLELLWGVGIGWIHPIPRWQIIQGDYKVESRTGLPKELANLTKLQTLSLAVNRVAGGNHTELFDPEDSVVPLELASLKDLRHLYIKWPAFLGCIPDQFSDVWVDATALNRCEDKSS